MPIAYAPQGLIGLLTPQANTTVEPEAWALLPSGMSLINGRLVSADPDLLQRLRDGMLHLYSSESLLKEMSFNYLHM